MAEKVPREPKEDRQRRVAAELQARRRLDAVEDATDVEAEPGQPDAIDSQSSVPTEPAPATPPTATMSRAFMNPKPLKEKIKNGKKIENGKSNAQKEEPFDPHSVATAQTAEEQKQAEEMRELLAKGNIIPPEAVRPPDVDISDVHAPQYKTRARMQSEMDTLNQKVDTRTDAEKLAEAEEGLRILPGMFGAKPKVLTVDELKAQAQDEIRQMAAAATADIGIPASAEPDGRIEPTLGQNGEPLDDVSPVPDGTQDWRAKWKGKLSEAVGKVVEGGNWYKSSEEKLIRRREELDAQAEKIPGIERLFRTMGEKYNKMPFKYKVALGASLGIGTALSAGTLAMALPLLGIAAQRGAGLATMYMKFEKNSHNEKWGKEKAMAKAGVYTVLLGLTMKEAIEYASQMELAHAAQAKIEGWLGAMLGHKPTSSSELPKWVKMPEQAPAVAQAPRVEAPVAAEQPAATIGHQASADMQAVALSPRPEGTPASATAPEPKPLVSAAAEAPQSAAAPEAVPVAQEAKPLAAAATPEVHAPAAPAETPEAAEAATPEVPAAKEPLAAAPEVEKLEADEGIVITEIQVPVPESVEPFVAPTETAETLHAPAEVSAAPTTEPEAPVAAVADELSKETVASWPPIPKEGLIDLTEAQDAHQQELDAATVEEPRSPVETLVPEAQPLPVETIVSPDTTVTPVDVTNAPEFVSQPHVETPLVETPSIEPAVETPTAPPEAPASAPAPAEQVVNMMPNKFGLTIPLHETHLYEGAGGKGVFVFGGTAQEKARVMLEFFKENPTKIIYSADETGTGRIPWRFIQGQLVPDEPAQEGWLFARTPLKAPALDDLAKVIK